MAFVKEEIPKEMIRKYGIERASDWCIDRERDAVFYHTGGNPRGPETTFLFIWKGKNIQIGSHFNQVGLGREAIIEWQGTYADIPESLKSQRQEVLESIIEAFACNNYLGKRVIFDPKMSFHEDKGTVIGGQNYDVR